MHFVDDLRAIDLVGAPFALAHEHLAALKVHRNDIDLHLAPPVAADRLGGEREAAGPPLLQHPLPGEILERRLANKGTQAYADLTFPQLL